MPRPLWVDRHPKQAKAPPLFCPAHKKTPVGANRQGLEHGALRSAQ